MIRKVIKIHNIGKFTDYSAVGDVEFRALTLVYAENGRGKTTLCDILRSLKTGNGDYVAGRRTLGNASAPEVCIRLDTGNTDFRGGSWTSTYPEIIIFDSSFVHDNVYAGDYVDHEHKKNLYRVIVGEEGVRLARTVDDLDRRIRDANRDISEKKIVVQRLVATGFTVETFLAVEEDPLIDRKVQDQEHIVRALEQAGNIRAKDILKSIDLPGLPDNFADLLARQLRDVSEEADARVREHIQLHLDENGEAWLEQGFNYVRDGRCGFCGQQLHGTALVQAYREHFSQAYAELKDEVATLGDSIREQLGERALLRLQGDLNTNESLTRFWEQFVEVATSNTLFDDVRPGLESLRQEALRLVDQKKTGPLEAIAFNASFRQALQAYEEARQSVAAANSSIQTANDRIAAKKEATEAGNLEEAKNTLARLRAIKRRYEPDAGEACQRYQAALEAKGKLENDKQTAKQSLDEYSEAIFDRYQNRLNELLGRFGAGFRIGDSRAQYIGGTVSSSYRIVINETPVELGDSDSPIGSPSFRNTLSSGDRSTLGLALFIAQLDADRAIARKVIVFDDPFTSQDRFRRSCTQQLICKQRERAEQVILLSHDPSFLKLVWDHVPRGSTQTLQMARVGSYTVINEWDIEAETRAGYFRDHETLVTFDREGTGNHREVVRCIRPVLEGYLRIRFPGHFVGNEWLGDFIDKIRTCDQTSSLFPVKSVVEEISDINDYSKTYHHQQNPTGADTEPIDAGELQSYVKRTLNLVGGY